MRFVDGLETYLSNLLGVTLYPQIIPQRISTPAIVYSETYSDRVYNLNDISKLCLADYQFVVVSRLYLETVTLTEKMRKGLHGFSGMMGSSNVLTAQLGHQETEYVEAGYQSDNGVYRYLSEYTICFTEN